MGDSEVQSDFDIKGLSLIDVSSEDDCLINSPLCDPINPQSSEKGSETKTVRFCTDPDGTDSSLGTLEESGKLEEPPDSSEQDKTRKNGKYNLRKSLAWDSAFFTSAGFLDPEELSSMLGGNERGEIHTLPGIEEDVNKSCDSLTTLHSETLTSESLEADLFEDIRASIQKSKEVSNIANSSGKKELKTMDSQTVSSSKKLDLTAQDKLKHKAAPKKPNIGAKDWGKTLKQVSVQPQTSQSIARSGESTSSLHKPPRALSRAGPISITPTKRVSLGAKNVQMEKDAKSVTGRGTAVLKTPALVGSRNMVPRHTLSSKSSSCSPASSKIELTTSCSLLESCASFSSDKINKSSLNMIKQKNESRIGNASSSGYAMTTTSKIASKGKSQGQSKLSTFLNSSTKLSSSISPASSISEWSSESSSSTSAANQRSNIVRASLGTGSCKGLNAECDAHQVLDSQNHATGQCSTGDGAEVSGSLDESLNKVSAGNSGLLHPASRKPSGLRMPSPKIGFFDGVRSSGCTPNGGMLSHPGVPSGLPKIGAKSTSPSGSSNKMKIGKLQPVRTLTAVQSPKVDVKQTYSAVKSRSSLSSQQSPKQPATKVPSAVRNPKSILGISPKLQNKSSPRTVTGNNSEAQCIGSAEKLLGPGSLKQVVGLGGKDTGRIKDTKIVPLDGEPETTHDSTSKSDVHNMIASKEAEENENHPYLMTDTLFLCTTNKKEEAPVEDQIAGLAGNNGAVEMNVNSDTRKNPIADSHLAHGPKEFWNSLSNPTSITPSTVTSEITSGPRIPFSVKDSFCNIDAPLEVLSGPAVAVDKTTVSPDSREQLSTKS